MAVAVLDASAFLAYLYEETGAERVIDAIGEGCFISAANWAEVLTKVADHGDEPVAFEEQLYDAGVLGSGLEVVSLQPQDAAAIAQLRAPTRSMGLSMEDRACLVLAQRLGLLVLTSDKVWGRLDLDINIQLIR